MIRVTPYITEKDKFFSNLKSCIKNNKHILVDFQYTMRKTEYKIKFDLRDMFSKEELDKLSPTLYDYKDDYKMNIILI